MHLDLRNTSRRHFIRSTACAAGLTAAGSGIARLIAQEPGERPKSSPGISVLNPRGRVPVGIIIDDSTCLVNLNRFAMPQFDTAFAGANPAYQKEWRSWPAEIPDRFVRKFGEWAAEHGVKGKYSIVPYPACVGRLDRMLPGWTKRELDDSLELVRTAIMPNWDIHPEMVTHTRVIDLKTGHPYPDTSIKFMENWEWTTGRSADELGSYMAYALQILKHAGLTCEGVTTPGGFANKVLPQLSLGSLQAVRSVFGAEIPHYFRHLYDRGEASVAPRVELARGLQAKDPSCVVSIVACAGDWTGGWDCSPPVGPDKFITEDGTSGRLVEVIERGEPALILAHWTGVYWNGEELGFKILEEVRRRMTARFDHLHWMKLGELARYWAARELTQVERQADQITLQAPFACPDFTVRLEGAGQAIPEFQWRDTIVPLKEVSGLLQLSPGTWHRDHESLVVCLPLPRGTSELKLVRK